MRRERRRHPTEGVSRTRAHRTRGAACCEVEEIGLECTLLEFDLGPTVVLRVRAHDAAGGRGAPSSSADRGAPPAASTRAHRARCGAQARRDVILFSGMTWHLPLKTQKLGTRRPTSERGILLFLWWSCAAQWLSITAHFTVAPSSAVEPNAAFDAAPNQEEAHVDMGWAGRPTLRQATHGMTPHAADKTPPDLG